MPSANEQACIRMVRSFSWEDDQGGGFCKPRLNLHPVDLAKPLHFTVGFQGYKGPMSKLDVEIRFCYPWCTIYGIQKREDVWYSWHFMTRVFLLFFWILDVISFPGLSNKICKEDQLHEPKLKKIRCRPILPVILPWRCTRWGDFGFGWCVIQFWTVWSRRKFGPRKKWEPPQNQSSFPCFARKH